MRSLRTLPVVALLGLAVLGCDKNTGSTIDPADADPPPKGKVEVTFDGGPSGLGGKQHQAATPRERPEAPVIDSRDSATQALAKGFPAEAAAFLAKELERAPKDVELRLSLAQALERSGAYGKALSVLEKGSAKSLPLARRRAHLLVTTGQIKAAEAILDKAVSQHPDHLGVRGDRLWLWAMTGRSDSADAQAAIDSFYNAYAADEVKTADDHLATGLAVLATGSGGGYKDANDVLSTAEELEPASKGTWLADRILELHGQIFTEKYAAGEALTTYQLGLERDPWQPEMLVGAGEALMSELQLGPASLRAQEALLVNPNHPGAQALLARIALIEGRRDEAARRVEQALEVNPIHTQALAVRACLAIFVGDKAGYAAARDKAFELHPTNPRFFVAVADALGFLHLYPESDRVLAEAGKLNPDNPYVQSALGVNALRLGKEGPGRAALEKAWKKDRFNERTLNMRKLYTDRIEVHYDEREGGVFTTRLPKEDGDLIYPGLVDAFEDARGNLDKAYETKLAATRMEVFSSPEDFSIRTVGTPSLGALGVCFGPLITLIGPYGGRFNFDQVAYHELAHVYAITLSKGRVPRWFTEGLSEWESEVRDPSWARESAELLSAAKDEKRLRKLSELELAFLRAESPIMMEVAYATATYAVRYLGTTYGRPKLVALLEGYAKGKSSEELFPQVLGKDLAKVEAEFETWFHAALEEKISGFRPSADPQSQDPRDEHYRAAMVAASKGSFDEATRSLEAMIEAGGDGFDARINLGRALIAQGQEGPAKKHLEKARTFHSESIEPMRVLVDIARSNDDVAAEMDLLEAVLKIDAMSFDPAGRLAVLTAAMDDPRLEYAVDRASAIAPLHPISLAGEALLLLRGGKKADKKRAKVLLDAAGSRATDEPHTALALSLGYKALGDKARAESFKKKADVDSMSATLRKKL